MSRLTTEQFKQHFKIQGKTAILSPQVAMIASFCDHGDFSYVDASNAPEANDFYDTVLIDIVEDDKFPLNKTSHTSRWFDYSLSYLNTNGTLKAKFPCHIISKLASLNPKKYQVNDIIIDQDFCILSVIKTAKTRTTSVWYQDQTKVEIDISNQFILHHYDENDYNYIFNLKKTNKYKRMTFSGSKVAEKISTLKDNAKKEGKYGLVVYSNIPKLRAEKLENTNVSSGSDCYLFDSQEERDSYFDILHNPKVIALAKNLSYNQTINVKVQSYLINPSIFQYVS
jgi:hypothetical protein